MSDVSLSPMTEARARMIVLLISMYPVQGAVLVYPITAIVGEKNNSINSIHCIEYDVMFVVYCLSCCSVYNQ